MDVSRRLKFARERVNMTLTQVRDITAIAESSISDFENGKRTPKLNQLQSLAKAYHRSITFFLSEEPIRPEVVLWREQPTENFGEIESQFLRLCEQYYNLEVWCDEYLSINLTRITTDPGLFTYAHAENLAMRVRDELQLGNHPGHELLRVLQEECGVKVFHLRFEPSGTAACTWNEVYGPAILLNSANSRWRRNFDLAHELFHLLTWDTFRKESEVSSSDASDKEERFATCFARNLLMPFEPLKKAINVRSNENKLHVKAVYDIARLFDVSIQSLLWQIHFLYQLGPQNELKTKQKIADVESMKQLYEIRTPESKDPAILPDRYHALANKALISGNISIGRYAEYLGISRYAAMRIVEQEEKDFEEIEITPT